MSDKLRILIVTEADPLYVINFFDVFIAEYPRDEFEIVGVSVQAAFHESKVKTAKRILAFYGPVGFARLLWRFGMAKLTGRSIEKSASQAGIPLIPCPSVNNPAYVARARELKPDVIVSVAAPEIFKKDILASARLGCVNIHSGRLPIYRGMMPNFWQLLHGEKNAVITIHEMVPKLDAGGIYDTRDFPLRDQDTLDRVIRESKQEGARFMIATLRRIGAGTLKPTPLDMTGAKYFSFPKPQDVKQFRARGHRMI